MPPKDKPIGRDANGRLIWPAPTPITKQEMDELMDLWDRTLIPVTSAEGAAS